MYSHSLLRSTPAVYLTMLSFKLQAPFLSHFIIAYGAKYTVSQCLRVTVMYINCQSDSARDRTNKPPSLCSPNSPSIDAQADRQQGVASNLQRRRNLWLFFFLAELPQIDQIANLAQRTN